MKALEEKILSEGEVLPGAVLKVTGFLNHRLDVDFLMEMGQEIARRYADCGVNKILTIEASGIALAFAVAVHLHVPVVYAKKSSASNLSSEIYSTQIESYTHHRVNTVVVDRRYLDAQDRLLIIDDFLASGNAMIGLIDLARQAGSEVIGVADAIEKRHQGGGDALRASGMRVESLAVIEDMDDEHIRFQ